MTGVHCSRREALCGAMIVTTTLIASEGVKAAERGRQSGLVPLDGIGVYYEIHGSPLDGRTVPLVLLHGGALTIEAAFSPGLIDRFARTRPVIAIEHQGHGHTPDRPERPITVEQLVRDTAGVLSHLRVRQADLLGHSLGGIVATGLSIRHPAMVRSITTLGTPYRLEGFRDELVRLQRDPTLSPSPELVKILPTETDYASWRASFERVAPEPKTYERILERLNTMLATWPGWSDDEMRSIGAPMLVAIGDNDFVRLEHAERMAHLVANGRLAVLPGTTHLDIIKRDAWLEPMMEALT